MHSTSHGAVTPVVSVRGTKVWLLTRRIEPRRHCCAPACGNYNNASWSGSALDGLPDALLGGHPQLLAVLIQFDDPVVPALAAVDHTRPVRL